MLDRQSREISVFIPTVMKMVLLKTNALVRYPFDYFKMGCRY